MMLTPKAVSNPVVKSAPRTVRKATRSNATEAATQATNTPNISTHGLLVSNVDTITME